MKTIFVNEKAQKRDWYVIDAAGQPLGRVAAKAAYIARGKNKATYTPNQEMGDYVVIINADKVAVTGGKETKKIYYKYTTGFVGSLKAHTFEKLLEKHPELSHYLENIVGEEIPVATISDIHEAFRIDYSRNFGKTVMTWNK